MNNDIQSYDVVIIGAGPTGLCFATSLREAGLSVAIVERQDERALGDPAYDGREIALTLKSADLLRRLGVWQRIPVEATSRLTGARVLNGDSLSTLELSPPASDSTLAYLVSNHLIRRSAYEEMRASSGATLIAGCGVDTVAAGTEEVTIGLSDGRRLTARIAVAADTRYSDTRRASGIPARMLDFGKSMLVCRMEHAVRTEQVACEWFGYQQTLAQLPIAEHLSSIVLTLPHTEVERLRSLAPAQFAQEITQRFQSRLGAMSLASERYAYPLVAVYPSRFVSRRYAVIGDAAVGMHPVTAHGFNLGLVGQDTLAGLVRAAHTRGADIASDEVLQRYDRAHRRATLPLFLATNAIVRLYTDDSPPARLVRGALLGAASRVAPIGSLLTKILMQRGSLLPSPTPHRQTHDVTGSP